MREFRLLTRHEIECRISEIDKQGQWLSLLLYKTARTDMALLDDKYGIGGWQNEYKVVDGKLFCGIGVKNQDGEWIWKWNNGTESNQDAEKGHASDAFKRAGFLLGIGTELYSAPRIKIPADQCTIKEWNGKFRCYDSFEVGEIEYDENEDISELVILCNGRKCFQWKSGGKQQSRAEQEKADQTPRYPVCMECGGLIRPYKDKDGRAVDLNRHIEASKERFGKALCLACIQKKQAEQARAIGERAAEMGVRVIGE